MSLKFRTSIAFTTCLVLFLFPYLMIYFLGYAPNKEFNENAVQSTCIVVNSIVNQAKCSESCNCHVNCYTIGKVHTCSSSCQTCTFECFFVTTTFSYGTEMQKFSNTRQTSINYHDQQSANNFWTTYYKEGFAYGCYYNKKNPEDLRFQIISISGFRTAIIVLIAFSSLYVVTYIVAEKNKFLENLC